jgi:tyrosyl-tRNA synthetase
LTNRTIDPKTLNDITKRGVTEIIVEEEFVRLLHAGKPLRLKMGFDPSRPDIHLGHAVGLRKLRQLQDLGHKVLLIVGDWTAQIGDPSGQSATRQMLTAEEVRANAETYMTQFFKVIDKERTQTMWQSEWFGNFSLSNVFDLTRRFTVAQFLARDDFAKRFRAQQPIAITELLYPLLQAYDSIAIESDVEFGGTDQMFNIMVGRDLQGMMGQRQQQCFFMPLLVGTDGVQKMSKSLGNYIGVDEPANEMYGKVMSIPDSLLMNYFELLTNVPTDELTEMGRAIEAEAVNPMELKKRLGSDIVAQFHDTAAAQQAEASFESTYQRGDVSEDEITAISGPAGTGTGLELDIFSILVNEKLIGSTSEAKRLLTQGAIKVDGTALESRNAPLDFGNLIQVGKRRFARIVNTDTTPP